MSISDAAPLAAVSPGIAANGPSLEAFVGERIAERWYSWAMANYPDTVLALAATYQCRDLLEVGGGRSPLLDGPRLAAAGLNYTVNDISETELRHCPEWADKVCFDIAGDPAPTGQYDLIFSRMVQEHVRSGRKYYRNIFQLLRPGGIALSFHPTLYAVPFVINYLIPSGLSAAILKSLGSRLTDAEEQYPKFPARYRWCRASAGVAARLRGIGFSEISVVPFYGHGYFRNLPLVREVDDFVARAARASRTTLMSSYAYTIVRK
jgi:SAM-dependent methyltransferase